MFKQTKVATIIGWILSVLIAVALTTSAIMMLSGAKEVLDGFVGQYGYPESAVTPLGATVVICVILYIAPQTAVLGAILLTGYFGGAVATHVRAGEGFVPAVIAGVITWLGLFLRDPRIRALVPLRSQPAPGESV